MIGLFMASCIVGGLVIIAIGALIMHLFTESDSIFLFTVGNLAVLFLTIWILFEYGVMMRRLILGY